MNRAASINGSATQAAMPAAAEFDFTPEDFETIAAALYTDAGIHLPKTKSALVYSRLGKRLRQLGLESFRDYCALIGSDAGAEERGRMFDALTTNVTRFFREPHHFDHLKSRLLPPLVAALRKGGRIRIWSAGCSTGQEPYSIALTILSVIPEAATRDIRILATDINANVVKTGADGIYPQEEIDDIPADLRRKWLLPVNVGGERRWRFDDPVRRLISFRPLNLMDKWPMRGLFQAIFCRNVVIYFDEKTQGQMWSRMVPLLAPGAMLYIGHSERVSGPATSLFAPEGTTGYRLRAGDTA